MRVGLVRTEETKHLLMVDMHHIISDGASQVILTDEFNRLYTGKEEVLPALRLQYKDYSQWQNSEEQQTLLKEQETFWLDLFSDELPVLNLPIDYPRPFVQSFEGNTVEFPLTVKESQTLKAVAKETNATLFMSMLAVFNILLSKLSGQEDIIVGITIAGRRHADLQLIIGMFVNVLAMRNHPSGGKGFLAFLEEVKEKTLAAYESQEYPFEELVDKINVKRDTGRNPVFDVVFNWLNREDYEGNIPGMDELQAEVPYRYKHHKGIAKFDLTLITVDFGERLLCTFEYCSQLFQPATIERFIAYFKRLLDLLSKDSNRELSELEIITDSEKQQILYEFNDARAEYPKNKTIHQLFGEQAARTPDNIAVVGKAQSAERRAQSKTRHALCAMRHTLSYRELNEESKHLAHLLQTKGVQPGAIVGVMAERSVEMVVGILGILKSGRAYLPIDPAYPRERIEYMLADSGAGILVSEVHGDMEIEVIDLKKLPAQPFNHFTTQLNLAYVIYTSGTTGKPKGVLVQHEGFVNLVYCYQELFEPGEGSRMSQVANPSFDAMGFEVWPCLLSSAALYIADNDVRMDPGKMKEWLIEKRINISFQSTAVAELLLKEEWPETGAALRVLQTAGDKLTTYPRRSYPFRIYNLYGPTEDTVWTTWAEVKVKSKGDPLYPSIGKPVANHRVYILDPGGSRNLQPVGVAGELCTAGVGVARGYLNKPELTAEKFNRGAAPHNLRLSSHSLSLIPLYRTGDLALWLPDGNLEFLGRVDFQVKIRGFRIELGEIENRLLEHAGVKEAVVITRQGENTNPYLTAYIVLASDGDFKEMETSEQIPQFREHLSQRLPDYMIPSYFVQMDKIPLTSNGKVDRRALPEPEAGEGGEQEYVPSGNEVEAKLVEIWSELLGMEKDKISINADFFRLGGHSLKAAAMMAKIQEVFHIKLDLVEIFRNPTTREIASLIKATDLAKEKQQDIDIDPDQEFEELVL
jgi:amino acid adenylation domain-containing protein